ncbi:MAG: 50S ribosomal protein L6 [Calditrichaeota bacterium]|nr:MAG: 50S ribosomal protein L6 [Calditrichota bacterium]MBL1205009.1 50S ribosomal protein L6 [Calditrichota bacterium]NOG44839.1 50S ribosomal protein L6 [Calditrichota bacterium]
MSRIGKLPVDIPANTNIELANNHLVVKGPKGELVQDFHPAIKLEHKDNQIVVNRKNDLKESRSLHGLTRALIANMVEGVNNGFTKKLEIVGIGYKAEMKAKNLVLTIGYSHQIVIAVPNSITIKTSSPTSIEISGIDKEMVGKIAAKIRSFRKPEPYKGKGIKYEGEYVRRKAGKTAGK